MDTASYRTIHAVARDRGVALIITLAVLFIIVLLAVTLATLTGMEQEIAQNFTYKVRSHLVARSGVEEAQARLTHLISDGALLTMKGNLGRSLTYWGNIVDESGVARPNVLTPLEEAKNPSFAVEDETLQNPSDNTTTPRLIKIDGVEVGYSGAMLTSRLGTEADIYTLKVSDCNGKIYVNDGVGSTGTDHPATTANLKRILNNLGKNPTIDVASLGDTIVDNRPPGGYRTIFQISSLFSDDEFQRVRNFITAHAWIDPKVVNPVPLSPAVASRYLPELISGRPTISGASVSNPTCHDGAGRIFRYGRGRNRRGKWVSGSETANLPRTSIEFFTGSNPAQAMIYGVDELNPCYIEIVTRAPVNVNTAPYEVLVALMSGLQGFFILETPSDIFTLNDDGMGGTENWRAFTAYDYIGGVRRDRVGDIGMLYTTDVIAGPDGSGTGVETLAEKIAGAIVANRDKKGAAVTKDFHGPFTSWMQFNRFIDSIVKTSVNPAGIIEDKTGRFASYSSTNAALAVWREHANKAMGDAIKANFNPNLHLNELNPNHELSTLVDKTDLIVWSTEFCFTPRGYFEIESLGRVLNPKEGGTSATPEFDLVAQSEMRRVVKLFDVHRDDTQKDFWQGTFSADGIPGDSYDNLPDIFAAQGYRTNGNLPLETAPEPDNGTAPFDNDAEGYLQLATIGGSLPIPTTSSTAAKVPHLQHKPKNAVWETPRGNRENYSLVSAHYDYDFDFNFAMASPNDTQDWRRRSLSRIYNDGALSIGGYPIPNEGYNFADWSESATPKDNGAIGRIGPYCYVDSPSLPAFSAADPAPGATRYKLARGYRATSTGASAVPVVAPADLRIDGYYGERHNGIPYWPGTSTDIRVATTSTDPVSAQANIWITSPCISMWVKPNYPPELAGRERACFNFSRVTGRNSMLTEARHQVHSMYASLFVPYHAAGEATGSAFYKVRPRSWIFGSTWSFVDNPEDHYINLYAPWSYFATWVNGTCSLCLNHAGHADDDPSDAIIRNKFSAHRWTHITVALFATSTPSGTPPPPTTRSLYINGYPYYYIAPNNKSWKNSAGISNPRVRYRWNADFSYSTAPQYAVNPMRVGHVSLVRNLSDWVQFVGLPGIPEQAGGWPPWNFSPDATIDEFAIWSNPYGELPVVSPSTGITYARNQYRLGRYYRGNNGRFVSRLIDLSSAAADRKIPPVSSAPIPGEETSPPTGVTLPAQPRIIGLSATILTEEAAFSGDPDNPMTRLIFDYQPQIVTFTTAPRTMTVAMEFRVSGDGGITWGGDKTGAPLVNPAYAPVMDPANLAEHLKADLRKIKYDILFRINGLDPLNSILLTSPVVDDVTIFYSVGATEVLEHWVKS